MWALIKSNNKWIIGIVLVVLFVIFIIYQWRGNIYQQGVLDERSRLTQEYAVIMEQQRQEYEIASERASQLFSEELEQELSRAREQASAETEIREIIQYVLRPIEVPANCEQLADDIIGVLQQTTDIIRNTAPASVEDTNQQ